MCRRGRKGRDGIARGNAREGGREFVTTVKLLLHSKSRMKNKWKFKYVSSMCVYLQNFQN